MSAAEPTKLGGLLSVLHLHHTARLFWALQMDGRVGPLLKIQAWCGMVYFLSPIDFLPDYFTGIGLLDDIILCLILMQAFIELAPRRVVVFHCERLNIDLDKVFVNVPNTVHEAWLIYNWVRDRFPSKQQFAGPAAEGVPGQPADASAEDEPPVSAEAPRYERYSALRSEES